MRLGFLVPARFHGTRLFRQAQRTYTRAQWRFEHTSRSIRSARLLNHPIRFVVEQTFTSRHPTHDYRLGGRPVAITHNTHDPEVFHELFVDRFYDYDQDIPAPRHVADLGGNIGMFALYAAIRWPGVKVTAFEPDDANASKYRKVMQRNTVDGELLQAAAATENGTLTFSGAESVAHITEDGAGEQVSALDVFPFLVDVDLIKMDIEGSEWPILTDERFATLPARAVLMEYHPHLCPGPEPQALAIEALTFAGYNTVEVIFHDPPTDVGMLRAFKTA
jgi:FkbM family methyltransferase